MIDPREFIIEIHLSHGEKINAKIFWIGVDTPTPGELTAAMEQGSAAGRRGIRLAHGGWLEWDPAAAIAIVVIPMDATGIAKVATPAGVPRGVVNLEVLADEDLIDEDGPGMVELEVAAGDPEEREDVADTARIVCQRCETSIIVRAERASPGGRRVWVGKCHECGAPARMVPGGVLGWIQADHPELRSTVCSLCGTSIRVEHTGIGPWVGRCDVCGGIEQREMVSHVVEGDKG